MYIVHTHITMYTYLSACICVYTYIQKRNISKLLKMSYCTLIKLVLLIELVI